MQLAKGIGEAFESMGAAYGGYAKEQRDDELAKVEAMRQEHLALLKSKSDMAGRMYTEQGRRSTAEFTAEQNRKLAEAKITASSKETESKNKITEKYYADRIAVAKQNADNYAAALAKKQTSAKDPVVDSQLKVLEEESDVLKDRKEGKKIDPETIERLNSARKAVGLPSLVEQKEEGGFFGKDKYRYSGEQKQEPAPANESPVPESEPKKDILGDLISRVQKTTEVKQDAPVEKTQRFQPAIEAPQINQKNMGDPNDPTSLVVKGAKNVSSRIKEKDMQIVQNGLKKYEDLSKKRKLMKSEQDLYDYYKKLAQRYGIK